MLLGFNFIVSLSNSDNCSPARSGAVVSVAKSGRGQLVHNCRRLSTLVPGTRLSILSDTYTERRGPSRCFSAPSLTNASSKVLNTVCI